MKIEKIISNIYEKIKEKQDPKTVIMDIGTYRLIQVYKNFVNKARGREVKVDYFEENFIFGVPILIDNVDEVKVI